MRKVVALAAAGLLLAVAGCGHPSAAHPAAVWSAAPAVNDDASAPPSPGPSSASPSPSKEPSKKPSTKPSPSPSRPKPGAVLVNRWGFAFTLAPGGTDVVGTGTTLLRYEVIVQQGLSESPASVASTVDSVLDNRSRGWLRGTAGGSFRFQRISSGEPDFYLELAKASTTDTICGHYGISTEGQVSCRGGPDVVINLTRWEQGTNGTTSGATAYSPADYRILVINHEVGHRLGHGHVGCPGAGGPAPVMMTQYFGLNGCTPNIWPYAADGTYVTGPAA